MTVTWAFDLYYKRPADPDREESLVKRVADFDGRLQYREENILQGAADNVCLTFEFDDQAHADDAARCLTQIGEHIEGPYEYG